MDGKFSQGGRKPKVVGKQLARGNLEAELAREMDLGGHAPFTYPQLRGIAKYILFYIRTSDVPRHLLLGGRFGLSRMCQLLLHKKSQKILWPTLFIATLKILGGATPHAPIGTSVIRTCS